MTLPRSTEDTIIASLPCGDSEHPIVLRNGRLIAVAHTEQELVLEALRDRLPDCVWVTNILQEDADAIFSAVLSELHISTDRRLRDWELADRRNKLANRYGSQRFHHKTRQSANVVLASILFRALPPTLKTKLALWAVHETPKAKLQTGGRVADALTQTVRRITSADSVNIEAGIAQATRTPFAIGLMTPTQAQVYVGVAPTWESEVMDADMHRIEDGLLLSLNEPTSRPYRTGIAARWIPSEGGSVLFNERVRIRTRSGKPAIEWLGVP